MGKGLFACLDILKGTRILSERPMFLMWPAPLDKIEGEIAKKLKTLPMADQKRFLSLHNNYPGGKMPLFGIMKTNSAGMGAIYPTISRINHSCRPNSHNGWNTDTGYRTIPAIRDIKADEEITYAYDSAGRSTLRRQRLQDTFDINCTCERCQLPPSKRRSSDIRLARIQRLGPATENIASVPATKNEKRALDDPE